MGLLGAEGHGEKAESEPRSLSENFSRSVTTSGTFLNELEKRLTLSCLPSEGCCEEQASPSGVVFVEDRVSESTQETRVTELLALMKPPCL